MARYFSFLKLFFALSKAFAIFFFALAACGIASAQAPDELAKLVRTMDAASASFQSVEAGFQWDEFEAAVQETDIQKGELYLERHGAQSAMAVHIDPPQQKVLVYRNGELKLFEPRIDHLTIFSAGNNRALYESFLTLGFGGSGTELERGWNVKLLGHEAIDGVDTVKLEIIAKQVSVRNVFSHVVLWIDPVRDVSLKQQFFEPSGDYRIAHYTGIKVNAKIPQDAFEIKTGPKTTVAHK